MPIFHISAVPCRTLVLTAVPQEAAPIARKFRGTRWRSQSAPDVPAFSGSWINHELLIAAGGVGAKRARRSAALLIEEWKPDLLVIAGVAGALNPEFRIGHVFCAEAVATQGDVYRPSFVLPHNPFMGECSQGTLLSLNRVLGTPEEKAEARRTGADAVEMETAGAAREAIEQGVRWTAVRAISDRASERLPLDFNALRDADGDLPVGRVALAALARPASIPGLMRLGRHTSRAARSLAWVLPLMLEPWHVERVLSLDRDAPAP